MKASYGVRGSGSKWSSAQKPKTRDEHDISAHEIVVGTAPRGKLELKEGTEAAREIGRSRLKTGLGLGLSTPTSPSVVWRRAAAEEREKVRTQSLKRSKKQLGHSATELKTSMATLDNDTKRVELTRDLNADVHDTADIVYDQELSRVHKSTEDLKIDVEQRRQQKEALQADILTLKSHIESAEKSKVLVSQSHAIS
jgi:hypothetical protein